MGNIKSIVYYFKSCAISGIPFDTFLFNKGATGKEKFMRILYALFPQIEDAKAAVEELIEEGFSEQQMNAVVQELVAKNNLDIKRHEVTVKKSSQIGNTEVRGLQSLLGGVMPVTVSDTGSLFAAGEVAATLVKAAAALHNGALKSALQDFQIPAQQATAYQQGIQRGGLLFWLRTDTQGLYKAQSIVERHLATNILSLPF